jgi:prolyl-tRNA editing enzyme YbaK/EbsC (Cys-tRNA(Pro) deacylase)
MQPADLTDLERSVLASVQATGAPFDVIQIDPALADTAAFCDTYGYPLEISGNCILVASRTDPPVFAACVALATTKLDVNRRIRRLLGVRKLSFASPELTRQATGMEIGGVTPFGLAVGPSDAGVGPESPRDTPRDGTVPLWVDARIAGLDRVVVGGGSRRLKLSVAPAALIAVGGEFVEDLAIPL